MSEENKDNKDIVLEKIVLSENVLVDGVESLYNHVKSIHHEKITALNVIYITTELMQLVQKYKELTGTQKKLMVVNVIKKLINSQVDCPEDRLALTIIVDTTLPIVIDNLIDAMKGNLKFDKDKTVSFFKKYLCCCCK
jgi:hypothetical protein